MEFLEVEAGLFFVDDSDISSRDVFATEVDAVDLPVFLEGVNVGPFLSIDGGLKLGSDKAGELPVAGDNVDAGEVSVVAKLDGGGGGGVAGVEISAMFFDDAPVAGWIIPAVSGFLNGEGAAGAEEDAGEFFRCDGLLFGDSCGEFSDRLEGFLVTGGGCFWKDGACEDFDDFLILVTVV